MNLKPVVHYPVCRRRESRKAVAEAGHDSNSTDIEHVIGTIRTIWVVERLLSYIRSDEERSREAFISRLSDWRFSLTSVLSGFSRVQRVARAHSMPGQKEAAAPCCRNLHDGRHRATRICLYVCMYVFVFMHACLYCMYI